MAGIGLDLFRGASLGARTRFANRHGYPTGPYDGLSQVSHFVHRLAPTTIAAGPRLTLLVPDFAPRSQFAGVKTALRLAGQIAALLGIPLRIISMQFETQRAMAGYQTQLSSMAGLPAVELESIQSGRRMEFGPDELWLATYWTTAHLLEIAAQTGWLDPSQVLYLVQDYEPCFMPWSTDAALAQATYHAGFQLVVNSRPLRDYLADAEGISVEAEFTFAPDLDYEALRTVAARRRRSSPLTVFFYARPTKPRNLYSLGSTALKVFAETWSTHPLAASSPLEVVSAGGEAGPIGLNPAVTESSMGQTGWEGYYELLSRSSVALSLMMSPHPSHPPLEAAVSGALSVTNRFGSYREDLHPRLQTVAAQPDALAAALIRAVEATLEEGPGGFSAPEPGTLGLSFEEVAASCATRFGI